MKLGNLQSKGFFYSGILQALHFVNLLLFIGADTSLLLRRKNKRGIDIYLFLFEFL
jgi:hypothetical protein